MKTLGPTYAPRVKSAEMLAVGWLESKLPQETDAYRHVMRVPGRGNYVFRPNTWHSIELSVKHAVPEWGNQSVPFAMEEDAARLESGWSWIAPRQTQFYLVR
ncbi:MAG: hypothetical protein AUJ01_14635 [Acidobacteria bacterium 13_1_40CM_3_65_5]|nr:MAG: hypothetical protein AUJ01_14635 [Acidobacteria bacterium 13_1_40CM_3_65_5]OLE83791.1 MAG: hypothetical protein AUF76_05395 [Acidobacteria bacterium 13_1_20CM_2_65_9]